MMHKNELEDLLNKLNISINEGIQSDLNSNILPRIVFWEYVWESNVASNKEYNTTVTYQISFFSDIPRDTKLLELKKLLNEKNIYPVIEHEYNEEKRTVHSYFSIDVLEEIK